MTDRIIIRTEAEALAYITAQVEAGNTAQPVIEDGSVLRHRNCVRCGGSGRWSGPWSSGVCFGCGAQPERMSWTEWMPLVEYARYLRTKLRRVEVKRARHAAAKAKSEAAQRSANADSGLGQITNRELWALNRVSRAADHQARVQLREHVGTVGEKLEIEVTLVSHKSTVSRFGSLQIYRFLDARGNIIVWMTSTVLEVSVRDRFMLSGKVKKHDTFRDEAQTLVTRVSLEELGTEHVDRTALLVACDLAFANGWAPYTFEDIARLQSGTADEHTELWLLDHPATRRALLTITETGGFARAA